MQETWVQSLGWEDPLDKAMATHSSLLTWNIPWTEEPARLYSPRDHRETHMTEQLHLLPIGTWWSRQVGAWLLSPSPPLLLSLPYGAPFSMKRSSCLSCRHPEGDQKQTYMQTSKNHCLPSYLEAIIYFLTFLCLFICTWSVAKSYVTLCDPKHPRFLALHRLPQFAQTHVHWVSDAIQPSHFLSPTSPSFSLSQHQGLFRWASSLHQVAKVLELQLQHQSFQWIFRTDFF